MRHWLLGLGLILTCLSFAGDWVDIRPSLPLVTVGNEVSGDWQPSGDRLEFELSERAPVRLWLFSPSIDSHQEGDESFGDDAIVSTFELRGANNELISMGDFPQGSSSWLLFYDDDLEAGKYQLSSFVSGKGKNVFVPLLEVATQRQSFKSYDPTINVSDSLWQEGVRFTLSEQSCQLEIYDGDGPSELMMRLVYPNGERRNLDIPDNRSWLSYDVLDQTGDYAVELRQTANAFQATNALRFRVSCPDAQVPLELKPDLSLNQIHPVEVIVIDTAGNALELPYSIIGEETRLVSLTQDPDYVLLDTQIEGGEAAGKGKARFGIEGGKVTFILDRLYAIPVPELGLSLSQPIVLELPDIKVWVSALQAIPIPESSSQLKLPDLSLETRLSQSSAFFCQTPTWTIEVANTGELGTTFSLLNSLPEGALLLNGASQSQSYLAPGERQTFSIQFELLPHFNAAQPFQTRLSGHFSDQISDLYLRAVQPELSLERISPETDLVSGDEAIIRYTLTNPSDQTVTFRLEPAFANLEALAGPAQLEVAANSTAYADFKVRVSEGIGAMQITPFACDPLALEIHAAQTPIIFREEVAAPPSLPIALHTTTITVDMAAYQLPVIRGLVLVQILPEGVDYISGTSFVNGEAASDPERADQALIFELPDVSLASLSFKVRHSKPYLATNEDISLIVLSPEPELLLGQAEALDLYQAAVPLQNVSLRQRQRNGAVILNPANFSLIRSGNTTALSADTPLGDSVELFINGESVAATQIGTKTYDESLGRQTFDYIGLELKQGPNRIRLESRDSSGRLLRDIITVYIAGSPDLVSLKPLSPLVADSNTALQFEVRVQDAWGNVPPDGFMTFSVKGAEVAGEDAAKQQSGFQIEIREGLGQLSLEPLSSPTTVTITSLLGKELGSQSFEIKSNLRDWIVLGNASSVLGLNDSAYFGLEGSAFARGRLFDSFLLTLAANYPLDPLGLFGESNFNTSFNDFPLTGSSANYTQDAYSQQGFYARLERDQNYLQYGDFATHLQGPYLNISRPYTGLSGNWQWADLSVLGYLSRAALGDYVTDLYLKANGTRLYSLPHSKLLADSLQLSVVKGDCRSPQDFVRDDNDPRLKELKAGIDYRLDKSGILRLSQALAIQDNKGACYYLLANYALEPGNAAEFDWQFGAQALYQLENLSFRVGSYQENALGANFNRVSSVGVLLDFSGIHAELDLAYGENQNSAGLSLSAQASYSQDRLGFEARYSYSEPAYRSPTFSSGANAGQQLDAGITYALSSELGLSSSLNLGQALETGETHFGVNAQVAFSKSFELGFAKHRSSLFGLDYQSDLSGSGLSFLLGSSTENLFGFENTELSLNHKQLIFGDGASSTDFSVGFEIMQNLSLRLTDRLTWGQGNRFVIGFDSGFSNNDLLSKLCELSFCERLDPGLNLGETTFSGEYELGSSLGSDAGRLLFNANSNYPINDELSVNLSASQITDLNLAENNELGLSLGATYSSETLRADASYDLHFGTSFKQGLALSNTFEVNEELLGNLSFDYLQDYASDPIAGFKFTVAAAYRADILNLLSRQDLRFGRFASNLEVDLLGDTRLNVQIAQDWSVRAAYIYALEPDLGFRDQLSLGASKLVWPGGTVAGFARLFHNWQDGQISPGASLEVSQTLGCGVNLVGGYNFFDGLGPNYGAHFGQSGAFLRLDFVFDEDWYCGEGQISGSIYYDANADGQKSSKELGISGLRVQVFNKRQELIATTYSDEYGKYSFKLKPGDYLLKLDAPKTYTPTSENPVTLTLAFSQNISDQNFGLFK